MPDPKGPPDKPGHFRLINTVRPISAVQNDFDRAEADGYEFQAMNNTIAVFYREDK